MNETYTFVMNFTLQHYNAFLLEFSFAQRSYRGTLLSLRRWLPGVSLAIRLLSKFVPKGIKLASVFDPVCIDIYKSSISFQFVTLLHVSWTFYFLNFFLLLCLSLYILAYFLLFIAIGGGWKIVCFNF